MHAQVTSPLHTLNKLKFLRLVDLRSIHVEANLTYWSDSKCASMRHVCTFAKNLKRRSCNGRVLMDVD